MYEKSKDSSPNPEVKDINGATLLDHHDSKIVHEMNKTMQRKPYLKQFFYDFLMKNNDRYEIFSQKDVDYFEHQKHKMQEKTIMTYVGMCGLFSAAYLLKFGLKRKSSLWTHGVKLI